MMQKKFLLGLLLVPTLLLSACAFDLGTFEKSDSYESYYEAFGDVRAKYDDGSGGGLEDTYNVHNSIFNDYTVNKMSWEKDEYKVVDREYLYIIITFNGVFKVESLSLFFKATENCDLSLSTFYYVNDDLAPKKIRYLTSPEKDSEEQPIIYDDPPAEDSSTSATLKCVANSWKSVTFKQFRQVGYDDGNLHTGTNSVLYIRAENNSGHNIGIMTPVTFTFLNLLVRAVE